MSRTISDADAEAIAAKLREMTVNPRACECVINPDDLEVLPEALRFFKSWNAIFNAASSIIGKTILVAITVMLIGIFGAGTLVKLAGWLKGISP